MLGFGAFFYLRFRFLEGGGSDGAHFRGTGALEPDVNRPMKDWSLMFLHKLRCPLMLGWGHIQLNFLGSFPPTIWAQP